VVDQDARSGAALKAYAAQGPEQARQAGDGIFGIENSLKSIRGQLKGLQDPALMAAKEKNEQALRAAVAQDPVKQAEYGAAWDAIAIARKGVVSYYKEQSLIDGGTALSSRLFSFARIIVRLTAESAKPETERLPEFTEARRPWLERQLFSPAPVYPAMEKATLAASLAFAELDVSSEMLGGKSLVRAPQN
jgi:hypothetical protein